MGVGKGHHPSRRSSRPAELLTSTEPPRRAPRAFIVRRTRHVFARAEETLRSPSQAARGCVRAGSCASPGFSLGRRWLRLAGCAPAQPSPLPFSRARATPKSLLLGQGGAARGISRHLACAGWRLSALAGCSGRRGKRSCERALLAGHRGLQSRLEQGEASRLLHSALGICGDALTAPSSSLVATSDDTPRA